MSFFTPHVPIGYRSSCTCGESSAPATIYRFEMVDRCGNEWRLFRDNSLDPRLPAAQSDMLRSRLVALIQRARQGRIRFAEPHPEAKVMVTSRNCYELRPEIRSRLQAPPREVRLYCAEPAFDSELILGLHLATKPAGPDTGNEVNDAVVEADDRAERWAHEWHVAHAS